MNETTNEQEVLLLRRKLDLLLRTGKLLMESAADTCLLYTSPSPRDA